MRLEAIPAVALAAVLGISTHPADARTYLISTGGNPDSDGYLAVRTDAHGSWTWFDSPDPNTPPDLFNPPGPAEIANPTWTAVSYVFVGRMAREIFNAPAQLEPPHLDPTLASEVLGEPSLSDADGDGVPDTLDSVFRVASPLGDIQLLFALRQQVVALPSGVSFVRLDYTVQNVAASKIRLSLLRTWDADLPWSAAGGSAYYSNDEVGTTTNGPDPGRFVFIRELDDPAAAFTLSGPQGAFYFGGKRGVEPGNGPPAYDYGTDIDWWLAYGVPHTWRNHIAGVGYDTDGVSGSSPPGSVDPQDAFVGLEASVSLKAGESKTVTLTHTYGQSTPALSP